MFPRAQFDAFRKANPKGGMTNLRYTFLLPSGVRTPMATGTEEHILKAFIDGAERHGFVAAEAENEVGFFVIDEHVMACDCGAGLRCDRGDVTLY